MILVPKEARGLTLIRDTGDGIGQSYTTTWFDPGIRWGSFPPAGITRLMIQLFVNMAESSGWITDENSLTWYGAMDILDRDCNIIQTIGIRSAQGFSVIQDLLGMESRDA